MRRAGAVSWRSSNATKNAHKCQLLSMQWTICPSCMDVRAVTAGTSSYPIRTAASAAPRVKRAFPSILFPLSSDKHSVRPTIESITGTVLLTTIAEQRRSTASDTVVRPLTTSTSKTR